MGSVLRVRLPDGTVIDIPAIMGAPGKDGKTPVKGTDYWTEDEKTEIINEVIAALPHGQEVVTDGDIQSCGC